MHDEVKESFERARRYVGRNNTDWGIRQREKERREFALSIAYIVGIVIVVAAWIIGFIRWLAVDVF